MAVPLKKFLAKMTPEQRARVKAEAKRMIEEELTLRDLRKAHQMTQEKLAAVLGVKQESVSNLEKRSDMLLSTLREYVEALGGELEIRAIFPGRKAITIKTLSDLGSDG
jgi:transcriptional regulator with XRE-family HTH domain